LAHENLRPSIVRIYLRDGQVLAERREVAKGWAVNPMTAGELEEKFRGLAETPLSKKRATRIFKLINRMENLPDVMPIVKELSKF
jgi:2-methylcitrate dehydratase PrpD